MTETHITVLVGTIPTIKSYSIVDGIARKGKVKSSYHYDYITHTINDIDGLYTVIRQTASNDKAIIIRGRTDSDRGTKVRRTIKSNDTGEGTFSDGPTAWVCIDFDEREVPSHFDRLSLEAIEWLIQTTLPEAFHDADYIYQWSASSGLEYEGEPIKAGTNAHLFFYLDKGLLQPELTAWFKDNKDIDKSVFRVVQPIFVNANSEKDDRIIDLIPLDQKIGLIRKQQRFVTTPDVELLVDSNTQHAYQVASICGESANAIIQALYDVGCVTNRSPRTLSLKSPNERTQGGYYTMIENPKWIHHSGRDSRRVDQWLFEEWGFEFEIPSDDYRSLAERFKKNYQQRSLPVINNDDDAFVIEPPLYAEAYHRNKRHDLTQKAYTRWKRMARTVKMLLYAFEGFGKSRIVHILVQDRRKVIFACKTNQQAEEQYAKFTEQGLRVQLLLSREYQLAKQGYETCLVKEPRRHPWDTTTINKSATLSNLEQTGLTRDEAEALWDAAGTDKINCDDYDVVVMTHTRLALIGQIQAQHRTHPSGESHHYEWFGVLPSNADCVWDDVDRKDFAWLSPFDNQYANVEINGRLIERKTFKKTAKNHQEYEVHYFIKPDCYRYGYGIANRQIFSTTEQLTTFLIERYFGDDQLFVPELMPEIKMKAGDITVFKTSITGRNRDGVLLPLLRRVQREGYDFYVIGDSVSPINHTNNKGQNCYDDKDIVVEVSQMNLSEIPQWLDELGWSEHETHALKVLDAMDRFHQAIGRNSGYRWSDKEDSLKKRVVVLMDGGVFEGVINHSRYYIDHTENLDQPKDTRYRKRLRDSLPACIAWYVQNLESYITSAHISKGDRKAFERDCVFVKDHYEPKFVDRMVLALEHLKKQTKTPKTKTVIDEVLLKLA